MAKYKYYDISSAQALAIAAQIAASGGGGGGGGGAVTSVANKVGAVSLVKGDVGLGNVDNTADSAKPVSTAQAAADAATLSSAHTYTDSSITSLVNGSPTALDTLKELADALGDDANFATTMTNALAGKAQRLTATSVKTGAYTAAAGDLVPVDTTSGNITITLPTAPADGTRVAVKHVIQGGTNTVSVVCAGSDVYNKTGGATTATLTLLAQAIQFQYKAAGAIWYVVADDIPLSGLDARYQAVGTAAGGVLTGAYPAPGLGAGTVGHTQINTTTDPLLESDVVLGADTVATTPSRRRSIWRTAAGQWIGHPFSFVTGIYTIGAAVSATQTAPGTLAAAASQADVANIITLLNNLRQPVNAFFTAATLANNLEFFTALWVPDPITIDQLSMQVVAAGSAGSVIRMGVRNDNGSGTPSTLLVDAGTVASATTGNKVITLGTALALNPGLYWLTATGQGTPATAPTVRSTNVNAGSLNTTVPQTPHFFYNTAQTGALVADVSGNMWLTGGSEPSISAHILSKP